MDHRWTTALAAVTAAAAAATSTGAVAVRDQDRAGGRTVVCWRNLELKKNVKVNNNPSHFTTWTRIMSRLFVTKQY